MRHLVGSSTTVGLPLALVRKPLQCSEWCDSIYLRVCRQYANAMLPVSDSANKRTPPVRCTDRIHRSATAVEKLGTPVLNRRYGVMIQAYLQADPNNQIDVVIDDATGAVDPR